MVSLKWRMRCEKIAGLRRGAHKSAAGLLCDAAAPAKRAILRLVARDGKLKERLGFDFELDVSPASVNQRAGSDNARTGLFDDANCLLRRASRRPNVLDYEDMLVTRQGKSSPKGHHAASISFHEHRGHSPAAGLFWVRQRSRYLLSNNQSSYRRRHDCLDHRV